tara:strand:+ start:315 stop:557 length:243 start_codon:yes stop_codon:yes gene_type:complete
MCDNEKKIIEIYEETHLPENGWLQGCMTCSIITSNLIDLKKETRKYIFKIYLCKTCVNKNLMDNEKFQKNLQGYIDSNYQ